MHPASLPAWALVLLLLGSLKSCHPSATEQHALMDWLVELGAEAKVEVRLNSDGVRGLFATEDIANDESIMTIPPAAIINVGAVSEFAAPTLHLMRELHHPASRYRPYLATLPAAGAVMNGCNLPHQYLAMLQSEHWEALVSSWHQVLREVVSGEVNRQYSIVLPEVVGNKNVTAADVAYACAVATTRYITDDPRPVLVMVPLFDMANHQRRCAHYVKATEPEHGDQPGRPHHPAFALVAGANIRNGDEVCYSYGDLRDDYAVVHYGFLPALESPPRLCQVDTRDFGAHSSVGSGKDEDIDDSDDGAPVADTSITGAGPLAGAWRPFLALVWV